MGRTAVIGVIAVNVTANTANFAQGMQQCRTQVQLFSQTIPTALNRIAALSGGFLAARGIIGGFGNALQNMVSDAYEFQKSMARGSELFGGLTPEQQRQMEERARQVAFTFMFTAQEVVASFRELSSAGLDFDQSMAAVAPMARFAQAAHMELGEAIDQVTTQMSAMGLKSEDSGQFLRNLVGVTNDLAMANALANGEIKDFSEAMLNKAATAAHLLGLSFAETLAIITQYHEKGVMGEESGTYLMMALRDVNRAVREHGQAWEEALGPNSVFEKGTEKFRSMIDILQTLQDRMKNMTDQRKQDFIGELKLPSRSINALLPLLDMSDEIRAKFKELSNDQGKFLQSIIENGWKPLEVAIHRVGVAWSNLSDKFFGSGLEYLGDLLSRFNRDMAAGGHTILATNMALGAFVVAGLAAAAMAASLILIVAGLAAAVIGLGAVLGAAFVPFFVAAVAIAGIVGGVAAIDALYLAYDGLQAKVDEFYKGMAADMKKEQDRQKAMQETAEATRRAKEAQEEFNDELKKARDYERSLESNLERATREMGELFNRNKNGMFLNPALTLSRGLEDITKRFIEAEVEASGLKKTVAELADNPALQVGTSAAFSAMYGLRAEMGKDAQNKRIADLTEQGNKKLEEIKKALLDGNGTPAQVVIDIMQANF